MSCSSTDPVLGREEKSGDSKQEEKKGLGDGLSRLVTLSLALHGIGRDGEKCSSSRRSNSCHIY